VPIAIRFPVFGFVPETGRGKPSRSRRTGLLAVLTWLCLTWSCLAQSLTFPALTGRVVDEAGLLNEADRAALTASSAALEAKTGDQLVVVTLKSLNGTPIEDYGYQLGRHWAIGQKDKNTGVLLIVAPNEHAVRIEVGYGLEGELTDAATKVIIETVILPRFKANDFSGGIKNGADQIIQILGSGGAAGGQAAVNADQQDQSIMPMVYLALGAVALLIFCAVTGGGLCQFLFQIFYMLLLSGGGGRSSSGGDSSFSGRGGSFGGGGSSGRW